MACSADVEPLQLQIRNVTFRSNGGGNTRGIELGIGTPQQIISLLPSLHDLDMPVWSSSVCDQYNGTEAQCIAKSGGVYDPSLSNTFRQVRLSEWNGTTPTSVFKQSWVFFNDRIHYGVNGDSYGLPLYTGSEWRGDQSVLPLGPNSSFLTAAYNSGQIPSTAMGIYAGSDSIEAPEQGLIVVGGFDSAGFEGNLTDLEWFPDKPARIDVQSVSYNTEDTSTELLDWPLRTIFNFRAKNLTLPTQAFNRFMEVRSGDDNSNASNPGNLSVTLANGFELTIPAYELFQQQRNYSDTGLLEIVDSELGPLVDSLEGESDWFYEWGMPFLSQVYLTYDYDRQTRRIAKARRLDQRVTDELGAPAKPQITRVCPSTVSNTPKGPSKAAIAGGVVGSVVFLVLVMLGLWLWFRRSRARRTRSSHTMKCYDSPSRNFSTSDKDDVTLVGSPLDSPVSRATASELGHSPTTMKSPTELPERPCNIVEMPGQGKKRSFGPPVEISGKEREVYDEMKFDKAERDCLYEIGMPPTPAIKTHFDE